MYYDMLPEHLMKLFQPKPESDENHDPILVTDPRQLANYIRELRRRKEMKKQQYRDLIIKHADKQHLDSNGMNVRQWIYEEETLPNEADKEVPLKRLINKADLSDKINNLRTNIEIGDTVKWNALGLSRMRPETEQGLARIAAMRGIVTGFHESLGRDQVYVDWNDDYHQNSFKSCATVNLERVINPKTSSRTADLADRIKNREIKVGDKVRVKPDVLKQMISTADSIGQRYIDNVGRVQSISYMYRAEGDVLVKWENNVLTKSNCSTFDLPSLELVL